MRGVSLLPIATPLAYPLPPFVIGDERAGKDEHHNDNENDLHKSPNVQPQSP